MKKVLYISYDGMTDPLGQSQVLPYLLKLSKQGYQFTILSFEKRDRFEKESKTIEAITTAAGIRWVPQFFAYNPPFLSKIYDRWKMKKKASALHRQQKFDLVHCRSYPASENGLRLSEKTGVKFLFDMRGFWADERVDNGQWNLKNPFFRRIYNYYKKKEKKFLLHANAIICLTQAAKNEILKKEDYKNLQIDVIPCCADLQHFDYNRIDKEALEAARAKTGIDPKSRVITYLGSVGGWYMTKEMFAFFNRLLLKYPDFVMLILTKDDPVKVTREAAEAGIPANKLAILYAARNELPVYIALSDCSIFFIRPTYSKIASSPTKHAELMGMGVPVICNNIGDTGLVIEESGTGLVVKEFNNDEYDRVISQMDGLLSLSKEKIRQAAFASYDLEKGAAAYLEVYRRILGSDR